MRAAASLTEAWLIHLGDGAVAILAPYNETFINRLKTSIPSTSREWRKEAHAWVVYIPYTDRAVDLTRRVFDQVHVAYEQLTGRQLLSLVGATWPDHETLGLLPTADPSVIQAAYRALAVQHHPDRGGSTETMKRINLAFERVKGGAA